ncbi:glycosyltransferase [Curtobacterium flaccumfaciens pv. oortii]|uniref:glycosyltransferase n=1 Tax=Curtobacterium flaccumfaciens TaxID=2035 RepID=UPI001BDE789D|nr:glycosyltransferase [Curtobacterium flaccumfaciens]MBT1624265.1 glycosyltransferase [Curtobacterium flaccumfaciens pv. oortii]
MIPRPRVSVIIPTVRFDAWLTIAVQSVLRQTFEDFEVIVVVDDPHATGSLPDDPRISSVRMPARSGSAAAINAGVRHARGEFIGRLDADDVAEPTRLAAQVTRLDQDPEIVAIGTSATVIDAGGRPIGAIDNPTDADLGNVLQRRNALVHSSMLIRRTALDEVGGYDPRCIRMQDYDLWLRLACVGRLTNLPERLTQYRAHATMHSRATSPFSASARRICASRAALARHRGCPAVEQHLRNAFWTALQAARHWRLRRPRYLAP